MAYFRLTETKRALEELDGWVRRKLRCILWRQWKRPSRAPASDERGLAEERALRWAATKARAVVEQWRVPHESGIPEVFLRCV